MGPPRLRAGTGKTLIARQIGKMLNGKEPKVGSVCLRAGPCTPPGAAMNDPAPSLICEGRWSTAPRC